MLSEGTVLQSRYRIVRQLGQGGMGAVYEAVDERLDTIVALKETLFTDEKLRKQFEREARLLARLHHPALPRVSDHFNESEGQFLVMQFIAGDDLAEMLTQRNAPFPQDEVLRWADQLCDALDYLHTQEPQIIHRDIKPQNLKLTARGQIVLLDFGLAKGSAGPLTAVTTSASIFGYTPNYAPLEQVQGMGTDARSDIYALAATLFHLLTNVKPPDALSRATAIVNGVSDPLPPASAVCSNVTTAVSNVLTRGMSQKRDDRFPTANDMGEAFRLAVGAGNSETLVTSGPLIYPAAEVASERATQLVGGQTQRISSQSSLGSVGSEAQTLVAGDATSVRTATAGSAAVVRPRTNAWRPWMAAAIVLLVLAGGAAGYYAYRARQQAQQTATQPSTVEPQTNQAAQPATSSSPAANTPTESNKVTQTQIEKPKSGSTQRAGEKKQTEQPLVEVAKPEAPQTDPGHDPNRDPNRSRNQDPTAPRPGFDPFRPVPGIPPTQRPPKPEIRVLPNGGRIIKNPDGTVVFIGPKGQTRVITPDKSDRDKDKDKPDNRRRPPE